MRSVAPLSLRAIIPSFKGFQGDLERGSSKAMIAAGATGGKAFGDSAGRAAGSKFRSRMASAAKIAAVGLAGVAAAGFKFAGDSLAEAREAQKIGAQTNAVIKSTGKAAKVTARDVGSLSGRLSEMAGIDDEVIQKGANVLLTFTKIRNEAGEGNKVFDRATTAALNMSVALGSDLSSASIQVGKALNDPVKGVTALGRAGVQFTDEQKGMIKSLVETGDTLGAQKMILRELDTQFKGSARAQATEADKLKVAWGNFQEEVGTALIPVMDDLATFLRKKGIPAARDFFGWVKDTGIPAMKDIAPHIETAAGHAKDLVGFLNDLPKPAKIAGLVTLFGGMAALKLRGGGGALGTAGKVLGLAKPVPVIVMNKGFGAGGGTPPVVTGTPTTKTGKAARIAGKVLKAVPLVGATLLAGEVIGEDYDKFVGKGGGALGLGGGIKDMAERARGVETYAQAWKGVETMVDRAHPKINDAQHQVKLFGDAVKGVPPEKTVKVKVDGVREARALLAGLGADLDWISRPREARITITRRYAEAGRQTYGGLQETTEGRTGGTTINIERVEAKDYDGFMTDMERRRHRAALEGRRP